MYMYLQLEQNPSGSSSRAVCLEVTICTIVVDQNLLVGKKLGTKLYVVISPTHFCYPPSLPLSHLSRMTSLKKSKDGAQRRLRGLRAELGLSGKEGEAS